VVIAYRLLSTKDVFGSSASGSAPVPVDIAPSLFSIPDAPPPPPFKKSLMEMYQDHESLIDELGLFQWFKPTGYFRYILESLHLHVGMEWWVAIACSTLALRLLTIWVPIMTQKVQAKVAEHAVELKEYRERADEAKREGNKLLLYQVMMEQKDFMRSKGIRQSRQFMSIGLNAAIFATQFFAIKKMVKVNYPGLSEGGTLWFKDLTVADPYFVLPLISAASLFAVMKVGSETGQRSDTMAPGMRIVLQYGIPGVVLVASSQFSSAILVYWATSNMISLGISFMFKTQVARNFFKLPSLAKPKPAEPTKDNAFKEYWKQYKAERRAPPSLKDLREKDLLKFKNSGRGKPYKIGEEGEGAK